MENSWAGILNNLWGLSILGLLKSLKIRALDDYLRHGKLCLDVETTTNRFSPAYVDRFRGYKVWYCTLYAPVFTAISLSLFLSTARGWILGSNWEKKFEEFSLLLSTVSSTNEILPPPPPRAKVVWNWASDRYNTGRKVPLQVNLFRCRHFVLSSMSLIFLRSVCRFNYLQQAVFHVILFKNALTVHCTRWSLASPADPIPWCWPYQDMRTALRTR